jgi:hypothetical protein
MTVKLEQVVIGDGLSMLDAVAEGPVRSEGAKVERPVIVRRPPEETESEAPAEPGKPGVATGIAQVEWTTVGRPSGPIMV